MKRIVKVTYQANTEEIETIRRFFNFIDTLDAETYDDFDNKIAELGIYDAIRWMLNAIEGD